MKPQVWIIALVLGAVSFPAAAVAQPAGPGGFGRGQDDGEGRRGGRRGRGMPARMIVNRLAEELQLSADQQTAYDALVEEYSAQWRGADGRGQWQQWRQQMRAARESGDEAKVNELREQRRAAFGQQMETMNSFFDAVSNVVDDSQRETLTAFRARVDERINQRRQEMQMRRLMRNLPDELNMTDEQRGLYEEMINERRSEMRGQREAMQPLIDELREARRNGDDARAQEIIEQLRANRPERPDPTALLDTVREMLTDEQRATLDGLVSQLGVTGQREEKETDIRKVMQSVKRLDLTTEQEAEVRELLREARTVHARASRNERGDVAELLKQEIIKVLNPEQAAEFKQLLKNDGRRERGNGPRGERRGRAA
jgi:hypothetical protein